MQPVQVTKLSAKTLISIELDDQVDAPVSAWGLPRAEGGPRSQLRMYVLVLAAGNPDVGIDQVEAMSLDDIMEAVTLDDEVGPT